ncbi:MAG: hypothetical protein DRP62_06685, partial [Planctomycetota bacterium]
MKRIIEVFIVLLAIVIASEPCQAQSCSDRAMWVWYLPLENQKAVKDFFEFCKSPHGNPDNNISRIFFCCRSEPESNDFQGLLNSENEIKLLKKFIKECTKSGIIIDVLDASNDYSAINKRVHKILNYNRKVLPEERFHGFNFDIEFFEKDMAAYKNFLRSLRAKIDNYNEDTKQDIKIGTVIARHWI